MTSRIPVEVYIQSVIYYYHTPLAPDLTPSTIMNLLVPALFYTLLILNHPYHWLLDAIQLSVTNSYTIEVWAKLCRRFCLVLTNHCDSKPGTIIVIIRLLVFIYTPPVLNRPWDLIFTPISKLTLTTVPVNVVIATKNYNYL